MSSIAKALRSGIESGWPLVLLRVGLGVMFVIAGYGKVSRGAGFADGMLGFINAQQNTFEFYRGFLETVVIPNKLLFAYLVAWGELLAGIALIAGFMTRWAALAGVFMAVNFWFAKGIGFWVPSNHDSFYILVGITLFLSRAGQTLGIDGLLARRQGAA